MDVPVLADQRELIGIGTGCSLEDLPGAMDDRDVLREVWFGLVWLFRFYSISTLVGYFMTNPFLYK